MDGVESMIWSLGIVFSLVLIAGVVSHLVGRLVVGD
jgi:hypothetical protein